MTAPALNVDVADLVGAMPQQACECISKFGCVADMLKVMPL
ncbi:hypothetical protein [Mycobacteroides franklinii]|nr:hypothetical protein [Mycobacteroides franklinii]